MRSSLNFSSTKKKNHLRCVKKKKWFFPDVANNTSLFLMNSIIDSKQSKQTNSKHEYWEPSLYYLCQRSIPM